MSQIALPLVVGGGAPSRIVTGNANADVIEACRNSATWPFRTALLTGPPRSGKSLIAQWFAESGLGESADDVEAIDEDALFHRWNRAQEARTPLLVVSNRPSGEWTITLPDLASRIAAAQLLTILPPDDAMIAELIALHAERRGLVLDESAAAYLVPRCERSHLAVEALVAAIDRISMERKLPPTMGVWREALEAVQGERQPRLL